jgi:hypothetical protein
VCTHQWSHTDSGLQFDVKSGCRVSDDRVAIGLHPGRSLRQHGLQWSTVAGIEAGRRQTVAADAGQSLMEGSQQQSGVGSQTQHAKSLCLPLQQIFGTGGEQSAVSPCCQQDILQLQNLPGDSGAFPLPAETGGC